MYSYNYLPTTHRKKHSLRGSLEWRPSCEERFTMSQSYTSFSQTSPTSFETTESWRESRWLWVALGLAVFSRDRNCVLRAVGSRCRVQFSTTSIIHNGPSPRALLERTRSGRRETLPEHSAPNPLALGRVRALSAAHLAATVPFGVVRVSLIVSPAHTQRKNWD